MCVPVCEHVAWHLSGSQRTICRSHSSYSPLSGFQGLNSAHEDWQQEPLPAEPSRPGHRVLCCDYLTHLWLISPVGGKSCPRPHWGLLWEDSFFRGYSREAPGDTGKHIVTLTKLNSINVFVIVTRLYLGGSGVTAIQIARRQCGKLSGPSVPP